MSKHTPGPWIYQEWGRLILDSGKGSSQLQVATVALNTRRDEGTANARLIASAPDLLEALEAMRAAAEMEDWDGRSSAYALAEKAIAKATGE